MLVLDLVAAHKAALSWAPVSGPGKLVSQGKHPAIIESRLCPRFPFSRDSHLSSGMQTLSLGLKAGEFERHRVVVPSG